MTFLSLEYLHGRIKEIDERLKKIENPAPVKRCDRCKRIVGKLNVYYAMRDLTPEEQKWQHSKLCDLCDLEIFGG